MDNVVIVTVGLGGREAEVYHTKTRSFQLLGDLLLENVAIVLPVESYCLASI